MIKHALLFLALFSLFACEKAEITATEVVLEVNQTKNTRINEHDYVIKMESIEDSRCPKNATCVWEGEAIVGIVVNEDKVKLCLCEPKGREMGPTVVIDDIQIELLEVLPLNEVALPIQSKTATFKISSIAK